MIRKLFVVLGVMFFTATLSNIGNIQASAEQIDVKKAEQVERVIRRAIWGYAFKGLKLSYKDAKYEDGGDSLIISEVVWINKKDPKKSVELKKITVSDYKESSDGSEYSFDEARIEDLRAVTENDTGDKAASQGAITAYSLSGVKGSEKKYSASIEKMLVKARPPGKAGQAEQKEMTFDINDIQLTDLDKLQNSFNDAVTFKALNGTDDPGKLLTLFDALAKSLKVKKVQITNLAKITGKAPVSYAAEKLTINDFSVDHIGEILMEDLKLTVAGADTGLGKIDRISLRDIRLLDIIKFGKFAKDNPGLKPTPERISAIFKWMSGVSVSGVDIKTPDGEFSGDYDLNWGKYVGLFPTEVTLDLKASLPVPPEKLINPKSPTADMQKKVLDLVKELGIEKLDVEVKIKIAWDENNQRLVISPFIYDVNKLYSMSFTASIGNISKAVLEEKDPKKLGVLFLGATVGPITLEVKDKGLQVFYDRLAKGSIEGLKPGVTIPELQPLFEDVVKLVNSPNGKLKIVVQPKSSVGLAQLAGAIAVSPMSIVSLFDLTSEFNK